MYSPVLQDTYISLTTANVEVGMVAGCSEIRLYPYAGVPYVYINDTGNTRIYITEPMTLQNPDGAIRRLVCSSGSTATLDVKQLRGEGGTGVRATR